MTDATQALSPPPLTRRRIRFSGWLLLLAACCSCLSAVAGWPSTVVPGAFAWGAGLLLFRRLAGLQRIQALLMLGLGGSGLIAAGLAGQGGAYLGRAVAGSQGVIAMLVAVGFLRLVAAPDESAAEPLPRGGRALWQTLLGAHFFGAAINFSALTIIGDRLHAVRPLQPLQATVLSRGFGLAALWSPFFVAMGLALTLAPGAQLLPVSLAGLTVALPALLLSGWLQSRGPDGADFAGYPMHARALWLPLLLVVIVLAGHELAPAVGIVTLITLSALLLPLLILALRERVRGLRRYRQHIEHAVPGMSGELALFLSAGVLTAGVAAWVDLADFSLDLARFGAPQAIGLVAFSALAAMVGIHPLISVSTLAAMLLPYVDDLEMLALAIVMSWSLGVILSPCSGMHLAMQGRFGVSGFHLMRWNWRFCVILFALDCLALYGFERFTS